MSTHPAKEEVTKVILRDVSLQAMLESLIKLARFDGIKPFLTGGEQPFTGKECELMCDIVAVASQPTEGADEVIEACAAIAVPQSHIACGAKCGDHALIEHEIAAKIRALKGTRHLPQEGLREALESIIGMTDSHSGAEKWHIREVAEAALAAPGTPGEKGR